MNSTMNKTGKDLEQDILEIFKKYDVDNSNSIDRSELGVLLAELQFPTEYFDNLFTEMDVNNDNVLQFDEFLSFYTQMQRHLTETAQAPVLAMTQDLLEEQRAALHKEKGKQEALYEQMVADGNTQQANESKQLLQRLKDEYEAKTAQLKQASDAKRARQKKFLEQKLAQRQAMKQAGLEVNLDD